MSGRKRRRLGWEREREKDKKRDWGSREIDRGARKRETGLGEKGGEREKERQREREREERETRVGEKG